MRALLISTVLLLTLGATAAAKDAPTPEAMAKAVVAGTLDPASVDVVAWRAKRPKDLQRLLDGFAATNMTPATCYRPGVCELQQTARWAMEAPDAATFKADMARLTPRLDAITGNLGRVVALAQEAKVEAGPEQAWIRLGRLAATANDPAISELLRRDAQDQYVRYVLAQADQGDASLSPSDRKRLFQAIGPLTVRVDLANQVWLLETVSKRGWFTAARDGENAANAAWQFMRHAPEDDWLIEIFRVIEPLGGDKEFTTAPFGFQFAILADRAAVLKGKPQLYGTVGECRDGAWASYTIAEPVGDIDARLAARGGMPHAEWVSSRSVQCRR